MTINLSVPFNGWTHQVWLNCIQTPALEAPSQSCFLEDRLLLGSLLEDSDITWLIILVLLGQNHRPAMICRRLAVPSWLTGLSLTINITLIIKGKFCWGCASWFPVLVWAPPDPSLFPSPEDYFPIYCDPLYICWAEYNFVSFILMFEWTRE